MRVEKYSYMRRANCRRLVWIFFSCFLTFFIPDFILHHVGGLTTSASRMAWREKIALVFLFLFSAAFFCFWLEYISSLFCDPERTYDFDTVFSNESRFTAINGKAVNWHHYEGPPNPMIDYVNQHAHQDLSWNFPTFLDNRFDCLYGKEDQVAAWLEHLMTTDIGYKFIDGELESCPIPGARNITGGPCFYGNAVEETLNTLLIQGDIMYNPTEIYKLYNALPTPTNSTKQAFVILDGYALDVTTYLTMATNIVSLSSTMSSRSFALDRMFLPLDLTMFLYINLGRDITPYFAGNVSNSDLYRKCLVQLFKRGVVPSYVSSGCLRINPALWATMGAGLLYFFVKMNLAYLSRVSFVQRLLFSSAPESSAFLYSGGGSRVWPHTILMVPCFAESADTLKQTLDTLSRSAYEDDKKLLLFVCDGITTSAQEQKETHTLLLEYLGYSCTEDPFPQPYTSLGQGRKRTNYARVYSGYYETGRNRVPYLVIVKLGQRQEQVRELKKREAPPGNRGKRDSLVLVFGFLERCMNLANNLITPLDYEIFNQCYNVLGIDPRYFKYILVTDADIQVQSDVVQKFVTRLEGDRKMLAVSGHVRPANPEENLTTMLQIFPVYMAFYSCLAYEACLGSVMTIQGGLVMYKIWTENVPHPTKKFTKKWKLLQQQQQQQNSNHTSQQSFHTHKWPKLSDEIMIRNPFQDPSTTRRSSSSDTTITTTTSYHHERPDSRLVLSARVDIRACCVHPTVLRGISTPQATTMHMQSVLLLGEEKMMPIVLLKSHPGHRLGFEPDAVGYATLPTNFFALQGLQARNIRAALHNQLEMQRVSWQLGITYWILSTTEILDLIFSMPVIVYLYGIFGRSVKQRAIAYIIIALSFTGLVVLHILFFLFRRQFRYILWFVLYCLFSLPLFAIWFPLISVWQSDSAHQWYDVWPIQKGYSGNSRLHGIIDTDIHKKEDAEKKDEDTEDNYNDDVPRLRLSEHEVVEARRVHQAAEAALDSNFTGFTGFVDADVLPGEPEITSPPLAQVRDGLHLTRITTNYRPPSVELYGGSTWRQRYPNEKETSSPIQSFPDTYNPFDDEFQTRAQSEENKRHRQSHSQSSYFTYLSRNSLQQDTKAAPTDTLPSSLNSSGFAKIQDGGGYVENMMMTDVSPIIVDERKEDTQFDRASTTLSIKSNTFSVIAHHTLHEDEEEEEEELPRHQRLMHYEYKPRTPGAEEGRKTALHNFSSSVNIRQTNDARRFLIKHAVPSSNSLSRHYEANHAPPISLRTQPSKVNLITHDMTMPEIQHTIKAEIKSYLLKADLATTTRAQVKLHLAQHFGSLRIDEHDDKMMDFISDCIEQITFELLN
ncbi:hypothetical protein INT47_009489 [Mucor saturninus]|uniref:chitin synthase n=1 Tax=Mucor saturninus TaxID=64648 RepID=A0A8H7V8M1_9FUNG|nr:hypothetical protein INT47_009489 [Mucor saturninus]